MEVKSISPIDSISPDEILNTKGLNCPIPLLRTRKALNLLTAGQILEIMGTAPGTKNDLPDWCDRSGNAFLGDIEENGFIRFFIRKG